MRLLPDISDWGCFAIVGGERLEAEIVFDGAQEVVVRVVHGECLGILLVRGFDHVAQEQLCKCGCRHCRRIRRR